MFSMYFIAKISDFLGKRYDTYLVFSRTFQPVTNWKPWTKLGNTGKGGRTCLL